MRHVPRHDQYMGSKLPARQRTEPTASTFIPYAAREAHMENHVLRRKQAYDKRANTKALETSIELGLRVALEGGVDTTYADGGDLYHELKQIESPILDFAHINNELCCLATSSDGTKKFFDGPGVLELYDMLETY